MPWSYWNYPSNPSSLDLIAAVIGLIIRVVPHITQIICYEQELGYEVALASANCDTNKMRFVLPNRIDDDIFTDRWFESPAFQTCEPWKTKELDALLEHFDTPRQCMMFFDDLSYNVHRHATKVGVHWRHVDKNVGVLWEDFNSLHPDLLETCDCVPRKVYRE